MKKWDSSHPPALGENMIVCKRESFKSLFENSRAPEVCNSLDWEWHSEIYIGQGIPKYGEGIIPFVTSS